MNNRFVYHYCSQYKNYSYGDYESTIYIDGIVFMKDKVLSMDDYSQLKNEISKSFNIYKDKELTVLSLSFIGIEKDEGLNQINT